MFSALAARAVADAAADDDSPPRWSFRALTGIGRDDGTPAAAAPADAGASPTQIAGQKPQILSIHLSRTIASCYL